MFSRLRHEVPAGPQSLQEVRRLRQPEPEGQPQRKWPPLSPQPWRGASSTISSFLGVGAGADMEFPCSWSSWAWSLEEGRKERQGEAGRTVVAMSGRRWGAGTNRHPLSSERQRRSFASLLLPTLQLQERHRAAKRCLSRWPLGLGEATPLRLGLPLASI